MDNYLNKKFEQIKKDFDDLNETFLHIYKNYDSKKIYYQLFIKTNNNFKNEYNNIMNFNEKINFNTINKFKNNYRNFKKEIEVYCNDCFPITE